MPSVTIGQICNAIELTLSAATGIETTQSYDEIASGLISVDLPLLQVYWNDLIMDPTSANDRTTFQGGIRQKLLMIRVDLYARQLVSVDEALGTTIDTVDHMIAIFEQQNTKPYFDLDGIQAFRLRDARRVVFDYTGGAIGGVKYLGARFELEIWVF